jgi:hypothetical protein
MRSSPFLAAFKWIFLTVVATGAVLWASFDDLAQQPPAPASVCPAETTANLARQAPLRPYYPRLGCKGYAEC